MKNSETLPSDRAYQYALKLLTGRDYTAASLKKRLLVREFADTDAEMTVSRLVKEGWLDDRRFAERFAGSALTSGRFFGPRLRMEMRRRGLPIELIDEVLANLHDEHDEGDGARSVIEKRFPGFSFAAASDREKRRVVGFLQRRGFGVSTIMRVMRSVEDY